MQYGQPRRADRRFSGNPAWVHQKLCSFDIASRWKRPNSPPSQVVVSNFGRYVVSLNGLGYVAVY